MRIARIEAIAYGAIGGRVVDLTAGLTVIHGPNESGKSSMMQLIRGVLFGFPALRRDSEGPLREPKGGGQRSGRVDIVTDEGHQIRIERTHGSTVSITDEKGQPIGDTAFLRALGLATPELFDTVQTFAAKDVAKIGLLDDKQVRANVLAAAVLGGGAGAQPVLDALQDRANALYKRQGDKQPYAVGLKTVTAARRALRDAEKAVSATERSGDALAEAEQRLTLADARLQELAVERTTLERIVELQQAIAALDAIVATAPQEALVEEPDPDLVVVFRQLLGDVPTAIEAARRAGQHRSDAVAEDQRAAAARERIGLAVELPVPTLAAESALREAAQQARDAEREATRLADIAQAVPAPSTPVVDERPRPRVVLGLAIITISLLAAAVGVVSGITAATIGGIVGVIVGAAVLAGYVASNGASRPTLLAHDQPAREAAAQAQPVRDQAQAAWRAALVAAGIAAELRPDQLDDLLAACAEIRSAEQAAERARTTTTTEETTAAAIAERGAEALRGVGLEPPADLEQLRRAVDGTVEQLDAQRATAATQRAVAESLAQRQATAQGHVDELARGDQALVADARALDTIDAEARLAVLADQLEVARGEQQEAVSLLGGTRALVLAAEESSDVASLAQAAAAADAELRSVGDQWLTLQLAHDIVEQARDRFVEEHQPGVFTRAAEQIRTATDGAWVDIRMPDGEKAGARSEIIDRAGERTPFTELSDGTVGLVYLCLRAGLVEELRAAGGAELPVLMDDVLTNLDPERRAGAAEVIADLATRHQVLYFTCHPEQVEALRAVAPGLTEIELARLV